jgi:predicted benzoate:H+ symporter BenE
MDPLNSIWYFLEIQRQSANRSSAEPFARPKFLPKKFSKAALVELGLPLFVLAVIVTFGVVCFLCPTFVS